MKVMDQDQSSRQDVDMSVDELLLSSFELHPEGLVGATFANAKVVNVDFGDGKGMQQKVELEFTTRARKENGEPHTISKLSAYGMSPKASIRPLLKALGVNVDQVVPATFKLSAYFGQKLALNIEHVPSKKDASQKHAQIAAFLPKEAAPAGKRTQAPTPPPPADDDAMDEDDE